MSTPAKTHPFQADRARLAILVRSNEDGTSTRYGYFLTVYDPDGTEREYSAIPVYISAKRAEQAARYIALQHRQRPL